ncbi:OLC1v1018793C1 [Oldenlandia corymbosa var. corymbosa]|uniref:OLC1v1018793C1 n=1 Tax=Oldenlandia corymbosa var. corymbosa TaxID=529605 RepID=A0AAV1ECJ7_OLDCO|nr:OLC1v1018793C1 [Oldenlandia corymbosa var. corymbosa]
MILDKDIKEPVVPAEAKFDFSHDDEMILNDCVVPLSVVSTDMLNSVESADVLNHFGNVGFGPDSFDFEPGGMVNSCTGKTIGKSMLSINDDVNFSLECVGVTCMNSGGNEETGEKGVVSVVSLILNDLNVDQGTDDNIDLDCCYVSVIRVSVEMMKALGRNDRAVNFWNDNGKISSLIGQESRLNSFFVDPGGLENLPCILRGAAFLSDYGNTILVECPQLNKIWHPFSIRGFGFIQWFGYSRVILDFIGCEEWNDASETSDFDNPLEVTDDWKNRHFNLGIRLNWVAVEPGDDNFFVSKISDRFCVNNLIRRIPRGCFVFGGVSSRFNGGKDSSPFSVILGGTPKMVSINSDSDGHGFVNSCCKYMGIEINWTRDYGRKNDYMCLGTDFGSILRQTLLTNGYGNGLITTRLGDDDSETKSWPEVGLIFKVVLI